MHLDTSPTTCTVFLGVKKMAHGSIEEVIPWLKQSYADEALTTFLLFDDATGKTFDVDFRGTIDEVLARFFKKTGIDPSQEESPLSTKRVGRPKLGVVSGEVTLLPRHWEWLKRQPGGASVTLRKLVEDARRTDTQHSHVRIAQEATYHVMTTLAGDFPNYEEALRSLYAKDDVRFDQLLASFEPDVRDYIKALATPVFQK
nr:DUF2239 family protein [Bacilli bacterium]